MAAAPPAASSQSSTMRAWMYSSAAGGLDKAIKLMPEAPQPAALAKDEILVKISSMSLNPADYKFPESGILGRLMVKTPAVPGMDYAGVVAKTGDTVDSFSVGQRVFGRIAPTQYGTLGEYAVVKHDGCVPAPEGLDTVHLSCIGTGALTAYQCIAPYVKAGDKVVINGGSGGTGTFGIQIAKALGCHVTTTCSSKNMELCKSLGADEVIDYTSQNVSEVLKAKGMVFNLVVDNVGSSPMDLYKAADDYLLPEGRYMQVGGGISLKDTQAVASRALLPSFLGGGKRKWVFIMTANNHESFVQIAQWMKEGKIKAVVDQVFAFEDAPQAIVKLKSGRAKGKIAVRISEE